MQIELHTPITDEEVLQLQVGDTVILTGIIVTGRDAAHRWLYKNFCDPSGDPSTEDQKCFEELKSYLHQGVIYHCGPVVSGVDVRQYHFLAAGPTTSIRHESYQADIMRLFNLKGVIGKGGMGKTTLDYCQKSPAVYFHAIGGAAVLIARSVKEVVGVYKLEWGVPEAMWVIRVEQLPVIVTMDAHGTSLHEQIAETSKKVLDYLIGRNA